MTHEDREQPPEYESDTENRNDVATKIGRFIGSAIVIGLLVGMTLVFAGVGLPGLHMAVPACSSRHIERV